jgi:hypothetical protein
MRLGSVGFGEAGVARRLQSGLRVATAQCIAESAQFFRPVGPDGIGVRR